MDVGINHGPHKRFARSLWAVSLAAGVATLALGLVVLLGWHTGNRTLIQVLPTFVPMQYNTALGFVFSGAALLGLLLDRPRLARISGWLLLAVGGLTLVEYIGGASLGIDELFMKHEITVKTSTPGRMAPNTAVCFTLIGLAAALGLRRWSPTRRSLFRVILGSFAFGLAVVALSGYTSPSWRRRMGGATSRAWRCIRRRVSSSPASASSAPCGEGISTASLYCRGGCRRPFSSAFSRPRCASGRRWSPKAPASIVSRGIRVPCPTWPP